MLVCHSVVFVATRHGCLSLRVIDPYRLFKIPCARVASGPCVWELSICLKSYCLLYSMVVAVWVCIFNVTGNWQMNKTMWKSSWLRKIKKKQSHGKHFKFGMLSSFTVDKLRVWLPKNKIKRALPNISLFLNYYYYAYVYFLVKPYIKSQASLWNTNKIIYKKKATT